MNPIDAIAERHEVRTLGVDADIWFYDLSTPVFTIRHYFFWANDGMHLFCVSLKDNLDDFLVVKFKKYLSEMALGSLPVNGIKTYEAHNIGVNGFDTIVILQGAYHNVLKHDVPEAHEIVLVAFPCHHSEFNNGASEAEVNFLRNKSVSTMNWNRKISPIVKIWFRNDRSKVQTNGEHALLSDKGYVFETMSNLWKDGGRMLIENYKGNALLLVFEEDIIRLEGEQRCDLTSLSEAEELVNHFLLE